MRTRRVFGISLSLIIINMAAIMERADENLLPAVYKEVSETFKAGPSDLGYLTFIRNFVQGIASPVAGWILEGSKWIWTRNCDTCTPVIYSR
uniref:Putative ovule protein n=1 Tax=Solanum chacoense TaxID=4108 RepID=A0A0V0GSI8_SOLCH